MLSTSNVAIQFGAKPLFEQVTVKFADGNRYGLIGANGSGKSTLMKVLGGELDSHRRRRDAPARPAPRQDEAGSVRATKTSACSTSSCRATWKCGRP